MINTDGRFTITRRCITESDGLGFIYSTPKTKHSPNSIHGKPIQVVLVYKFEDGLTEFGDYQETLDIFASYMEPNPKEINTYWGEDVVSLIKNHHLMFTKDKSLLREEYTIIGRKETTAKIKPYQYDIEVIQYTVVVNVTKGSPMYRYWRRCRVPIGLNKVGDKYKLTEVEYAKRRRKALFDVEIAVRHVTVNIGEKFPIRKSQYFPIGFAFDDCKIGDEFTEQEVLDLLRDYGRQIFTRDSLKALGFNLNRERVITSDDVIVKKSLGMFMGVEKEVFSCIIRTEEK